MTRCLGGADDPSSNDALTSQKRWSIGSRDGPSASLAAGSPTAVIVAVDRDLSVSLVAAAAATGEALRER